MPQNEASDQFQTFTLSNAAGMKVGITPIGGLVMSIQLPDKKWRPNDVVLGQQTAKDYVGGKGFYGLTIPVACDNLIMKKFTLNGKDYRLGVNNGEKPSTEDEVTFATLNGTAKKIATYEGKGFELTYPSKDGERRVSGQS